ncbi:transposase [Serratia fonticola]|uniref:transposase n=1 Tax=Serratia fonticola TaxID=47917 RepID=UPI0036F1FB5E
MIYPQSPLFQAGWLKPDTVVLHVTKGVTNSACRTLDSFNAIESLNSVIRQAIKERKVFPTDDSVRKVIYLAIESASKKWSMPFQNWQLKMSRFIIEFGDHLNDHL